MPPRWQLLTAQPSTFSIAIHTSKPVQRTYASAAAPPPVVKNPLQRRQGGDLGSHLPIHIIPEYAYIPPYPYGDHALFKQANRGLYGSQRIQFGNNVSHKSETKTRRSWKPNILTKSLYSVALKKKIKLRVSSKVLRTMDREGGLDEYLLKDSEHRLKELGPLGWALRWTLLQRPTVIERIRADAASWGIDQATIDKKWPLPQARPDSKQAQSGLVKARDLIGETTPGIKAEYQRIQQSAQEYLQQGWVDSLDDGLKAASIRESERQESLARQSDEFYQQLKEQFNKEDLVRTRRNHKLPATLNDDEVRKFAWQVERSKKGGSDKAGEEELSLTQGIKKDAEIEEAGGHEAYAANQKAIITALLQEAETASTNESLDKKRRVLLQTALKKAERAIRAKAEGGSKAYIKSTIAGLKLDNVAEAQVE